jgi:hypothetical protein
MFAGFPGIRQRYHKISAWAVVTNQPLLLGGNLNLELLAKSSPSVGDSVRKLK